MCNSKIGKIEQLIAVFQFDASCHFSEHWLQYFRSCTYCCISVAPVQNWGQAPQGRHCKQEASHSPMDCPPPLQALFEVALIHHSSDSFLAKESKDFNNWKCKPERKKEKKLLDKDLVVKKETGSCWVPHCPNSTLNGCEWFGTYP